MAEVAPQKFALLIGISKYERGGGTPPDWWNLSSHNDIVAMKKLLVDTYAFSDAGITVLEDDKATKTGIIAALQELAAKAKQGDTVVVHYSGHGQRVPDDGDDELDGLDESIIPYDYISQKASDGAKSNLRDDQLGALLNQIAAKMKGPDGKLSGNLTVVVDCCFSGTATRGEPPAGRLRERGRGWDSKIDGPLPKPTKSGDDSEMLGGRESVPGIVILAACRSDETAKETTADGGDGMGILTYSLTRAFAQATPTTTYRAVMERMRVEIQEQDPQCEGDLDRVVLGGTALRAQPYVVARYLDNDSVQIPLGLLHGQTVGSKFSLYAAGSDVKNEKNKIADATASEVREATSTLTLNQPLDKTQLSAARAVETTRAIVSAPLHVLTTEAKAQKALATVTTITLYGVTEKTYDIKVALQDGIWNMERRDGKKLPSIPDGPGALDELRETLMGQWRWVYLSKLRNQDSDPAIKVVCKLIPLDDDGKERKVVERGSAGRILLREGQKFDIAVKNLSSIKVYITVLDLAENGAIGPVYPDYSSTFAQEAVPADEQWHRLHGRWNASPPFGLDILKVIATPDPVDFQSALWSPKTRGTSEEMDKLSPGAKALANVLFAASSGTRGVAAEAPPPSFWNTVDIVFETRDKEKEK